ncbi:MAG: methyltetrahydrofolate cobalamin methyltransferase [Pseudomonadota bacterium]
MTETVVSSATKTAIIGFEQPFCVIGERINPTGRKKLAAEMIEGNFTTVEADALAQVAAGATMLDVNAGVTAVDPNKTEPPLLAKTIELVQSLVDAPISIDSSVPAALEAGLAVCKGRPLVNSVTGETDRLEIILPLVKKYDVPVVAISNDESGISEDPDVRFNVARKIVEHAADYGIPAHDIVVDPLVMPIGAMNTAGRQVFALVRRLREELKVNTTCGASNISFGLPNRRAMNAHFLSMASAIGMTSAIMNPLHREDMDAIRAANTLNGFDPDCRQWLMANRPEGEGGAEGRRERRTGRRRVAAA